MKLGFSRGKGKDTELTQRIETWATPSTLSILKKVYGEQRDPKPLAEEAAKQGDFVGVYEHIGWMLEKNGNTPQILRWARRTASRAEKVAAKTFRGMSGMSEYARDHQQRARNIRRSR